jgi:Homeodomain-like domain
MPRQRLSMRQVYDVLRLKWGAGLSDRQIAQSLGLSRPTVANYVQRAQAAGLYWPLPDGLDEAALEARLFPPPTPKGALVQGWSCDIYGPARAVKGLPREKTRLGNRCSHISDLWMKASWTFGP